MDAPKIAAASQVVQWPELPRTGFISGRAATEADVRAGNAVFMTRLGDKPSARPLNVAVPQYALWRDTQTGVQHAVIVIQAEEADNGKKLVAVRFVDSGRELVAMLVEVKLLGTQKPK